eukprot:m.140464 g.140464  ORF g.140464 m.140464 type:complete len:565 (+) comp14826_c1_seq8:143-1837(+)
MLLFSVLTCIARGDGVPTAINTTVILPDDLISLHFAAYRTEHGKNNQVVMEPQYPWDEEIGGKGTVLVDPYDNKYKIWYISQPTLDITGSLSGAGTQRMITYAESQDGVTWTRPMLSIVPFANYNKTNILLNVSDGQSIQYACVFIDNPTAPRFPPAKRYEMMVMAMSPPLGLPKCTTSSKCMFRLWSSDGLNWNPGETLNFPEGFSDSLYINRRSDGSYFGLVKTSTDAPPGAYVPFDIAAGDIRTLAYTESDNGTVWSPLQRAWSPDWRDSPGTQIISSVSTILAQSVGPPNSSVYVGHIPILHALSQRISLQWTASRTGQYPWFRPTRFDAIPLTEMGEYGSGMQWPYRNFVPDRDDPTVIHAYFSGCQGIHGDIHSTWPRELFKDAGFPQTTGVFQWDEAIATKDSHSPVRTNIWFRGALMRASWTQGRFWGIVPAAGRDIPGVIVTKGYDTNTSSGKRLFANLNATRGYIVAEVLYDTTSKLRTSLSSEHGVELANLVPVPGYSLSDCDNITKVDNPSRMVTWGNGKHTTLPTLTTNQGKVIAIRFVIKEAVLYGFQFL